MDPLTAHFPRNAVGMGTPVLRSVPLPSISAPLPNISAPLQERVRRIMLTNVVPIPPPPPPRRERVFQDHGFDSLDIQDRVLRSRYDALLPEVRDDFDRLWDALQKNGISEIPPGEKRAQAFIIDKSGSMDGSSHKNMEYVSLLLAHLAEKLKEPISVYGYGSSTVQLTPWPDVKQDQYSQPHMPAKIMRGILPLDGSTDARTGFQTGYESVESFIQENPAYEGKGRVVCFTDGDVRDVVTDENMNHLIYGINLNSTQSDHIKTTFGNDSFVELEPIHNLFDKTSRNALIRTILRAYLPENIIDKIDIDQIFPDPTKIVAPPIAPAVITTPIPIPPTSFRLVSDELKKALPSIFSVLVEKNIFADIDLTGFTPQLVNNHWEYDIPAASALKYFMPRITGLFPWALKKSRLQLRIPHNSPPASASNTGSANIPPPATPTNPAAPVSTSAISTPILSTAIPPASFTFDGRDFYVKSEYVPPDEVEKLGLSLLPWVDEAQMIYLGNDEKRHRLKTCGQITLGMPPDISSIEALIKTYGKNTLRYMDGNPKKILFSVIEEDEVPLSKIPFFDATDFDTWEQKSGLYEYFSGGSNNRYMTEGDTPLYFSGGILNGTQSPLDIKDMIRVREIDPETQKPRISVYKKPPAGMSVLGPAKFLRNITNKEEVATAIFRDNLGMYHDFSPVVKKIYDQAQDIRSRIPDKDGQIQAAYDVVRAFQYTSRVGQYFADLDAYYKKKNSLFGWLTFPKKPINQQPDTQDGSGLMMFERGVGVCSGYAKAFLLLLSFLEIPDVEYVSGVAPTSGIRKPASGWTDEQKKEFAHGWIKIGNLHYDPTWDHQHPGSGGKWFGVSENDMRFIHSRDFS